MTTHEQAIWDAGYCRCPNHPQRWYPRGPNVPVLDIGMHSVYVRDDGSIQIGQYSNGEEIIIRQFATVSEYLASCDGKSEGGQPAGYMNVWD